MSLREWSPGKEVTSLRGAWTYTAERHKGNPARANWAANMRVNPGVVVTRRAMVPIQYSAHSLVSGLFNWIAPDETNYVLYQDRSGMWAITQGDGQVLVHATTYRMVSRFLSIQCLDLLLWLVRAGVW